MSFSTDKNINQLLLERVWLDFYLKERFLGENIIRDTEEIPEVIPELPAQAFAHDSVVDQSSAFGLLANPGSLFEYSRGDHSHGTPTIHVDGVSIKGTGNHGDPLYVIDDDEQRTQNMEMLSTGHIWGGFVTPIGGVNIRVAAGHGWITDNRTYFKSVDWVAQDIAGVGDGENFIYIDITGRAFCSQTVDDYYNNIEVGVMLTGGGNTQIVELINSPYSVADFPMRVMRYQEIVVRSVIGYGCTVQELDAPDYLKLRLNAGAMFVNFNEHFIDVSSVFTKLYLTSNYGWVPSYDLPNQIQPNIYNDITKGYGSALVPLTDTYWKKDLIMLTPSNHIFVVCGQAEYSTKDDALNAPLPTLPSGVDSVAAFMYVIVCQKEDISISNRLVDIRPYMPRLYLDTQNVNKVPTGGTVGQILTKINSTDFNAEWADNAPVGLNMEIQINDNGVRGSSPDFKYDKTNKSLMLNGADAHPNSPIAAIGDFDSYVQLNIKNINTGIDASSDIVATADTGTDEEHYANMGICNSNYSDPEETLWLALDAYLLSNGGDLTVGTETPGTVVKFHTGGVMAENVRGEVDDDGINLSAGNSFRVAGFNLMNIITTAANAEEEAAAFAAGSKIVVRTDLL